MQNIIKIITIPLLLLLGIYIYTEHGDVINADYLRQQNDAVQTYYQHNQLLTIILFTLFCTLYIGAAIPGGQLTPVAAGLFFGYGIGFTVSLVCYGFGPLLTFLLSRYCIGNAIQHRFADKLERFNRGIEKDGIWYLFVLRHVPVPFFITNLCMGLTTLTLKRYFWGSLLSLLPNTIAFVYLGGQLATVNRYSDVVSPQLLLAYVLSVVIPPLAAKLIINLYRKSTKK